MRAIEISDGYYTTNYVQLQEVSFEDQNETTPLWGGTPANKWDTLKAETRPARTPLLVGKGQG